MHWSNTKKITVYILSVLSAVIVGASCFLLTITLHNRSSEQAVQQSSSNLSESRDYLYYMCEKDGQIIVFKKGQEQPIHTLETDPAILPEKDQKLLKQGIYLNSDQELRKLLEDYDD